MLNFIVPIKDHSSVDNWSQVNFNLSRTLNSINNQVDSNWLCFLVCNEGCVLPPMPSTKFKVLQVKFQNDDRIKSNNLKIKYDAIREDKGKRVNEALKCCLPEDHFMVVDYDDFVSCKISDYVSKNRHISGWYISKGYYFSGGRALVKDNKFNLKCGTSNIISVSFVNNYMDDTGSLPMNVIKELLGSHVFIKKYMEEEKVYFPQLPFSAAIYNVGIQDSTSGTSGIFKLFFTRKILFSRPDRWVRKLFCIRFLTKKIKNNFNVY